MAQVRCHCSICAARMARGEQPLEGVSVSTAAHVTADEVPASRRSRISKRRATFHTKALPQPVFTQEIIRAEAGKLIVEVMGRVLLVIHQETDAKFAALEAQITGLRNAMSEFKFVGQWQEIKTYKAGNFVTTGGQVWHCNSDTNSRPGMDSTWSLAVKSGRDGRDGKDFVPEPPGGPRTVRSMRR